MADELALSTFHFVWRFICNIDIMRGGLVYISFVTSDMFNTKIQDR